MKTFASQLVCVATTFCLGLGATSAYSGSAPREVRVKSVTSSGTGCPAGSVAYNLSSDRKAFTLMFDEYIAEVGPGLSKSDGRKFCDVLVDFKVPHGWSYSIYTVDYRGFADLDRGIRGYQQTDYFFQGQRGSARMRTHFKGPMADDYEVRDELDLEAMVWAPCGGSRALHMKTQVYLRKRGNKEGILTLDSMDNEVRQIYGIQWKRCRR